MPVCGASEKRGHDASAAASGLAQSWRSVACFGLISNIATPPSLCPSASSSSGPAQSSHVKLAGWASVIFHACSPAGEIDERTCSGTSSSSSSKPPPPDAFTTKTSPPT